MTADAAAIAAVQEAVDNAADAASEFASEGYEPPEVVKVLIRYVSGTDDREEAIIIEDNAGGLPPDRLHILAQLGASYSTETSIGRFGVGASRLAALGSQITYASHRAGYESQQFTVDIDEMKQREGADAFRSPRQLAPDLPERKTRVTITNLRNGFKPVVESARRAIGQQKEGEENDEITAADISAVGQALGRTYQRLIRNGVKIDTSARQKFEIKLVCEGETEHELSVTPPEEISYSYLPFDGLAPREYTEIPFDKRGDSVDSSEAAVTADIKVGLMTNADDKLAGLSVAVNDRMIIAHDTGNDLFSTSYLGAYRPEQGHSRLYIEVNLHGDSEHMPFNSTKTGLNPNHEVFDPLLNRVASVAIPYKRQTYAALPDWMLEIYGEDDPRSEGQRATELRIPKSGSKTNSARFNEKPGKSVRGRRTRDYPERDRLIGIVKVHRALRIRDEKFLQPTEIPAYRNFFETRYYVASADDYLRGQSEYTPRTPEETDSPLLDEWAEYASVKEDELSLIRDIKVTAKLAYTQIDGRLDTAGVLEPWAVPRYREELRVLASGSLEGLATWDDPREIPIEEFIEVSVTLDDDEEAEAYTFPDQSPIFDYKRLEKVLRTRGLINDTTDEHEGGSGDDSSSTEVSEDADEPSSEATEEEQTLQDRAPGVRSSPNERSSVFKASQPERDGRESADSGPTETTGDGLALIVSGDRYVLNEDELETLLGLLDLDEDIGAKQLYQALVSELKEGRKAKANLEDIRERVMG